MSDQTMNEVSLGCGCDACASAADSTSSNNTMQYSEDLSSSTIYSHSFFDNNTASDSNANNLQSGSEWSQQNLTYSFLNFVPSYYASNQSAQSSTNSFISFTNTMEAATRDVLDMVASYTNLTFQEVSHTGSQVGTITLGRSDMGSTTAGRAYFPTTNPVGGDVWMRRFFNDSEYGEGESALKTLIHEIGHAMGLQHSFSSGLSGAEDSYQYTVMAYSNTNPWSGDYPSTFMMYDISALQNLYGVNTSYNAGDTVYNLESGKIWTLWDAGGNDTLNGASLSDNLVINLNEATFSSVGLTQNMGIAFGVTIENANGGSGHAGAGNDNVSGDGGNDRLYGNSGDDYIYGDNGNDVLLGNDGNDNIFGGTGNDILNGGIGDDILDGGAGDNKLYGGAGDDIAVFEYDLSDYTIQIKNSVTVSLQYTLDNTITTSMDIENFVFNNVNYTFDQLEQFYNQANNLTNQRIGGNAGDDNISGGGGNDVIIGNQGDDNLVGGAGDDVLNGGVGNDVLNGGSGKNKLYGGSGDDIFMIDGSADGGSTIMDFKIGEDRIDISDLLSDYNPTTDDINDFVSIVELWSGNLNLAIDADGQGNAQSPEIAARVIGFEGLTVQNLDDAGAFII